MYTFKTIILNRSLLSDWVQVSLDYDKPLSYLYIFLGSFHTLFMEYIYIINSKESNYVSWKYEIFYILYAVRPRHTL